MHSVVANGCFLRHQMEAVHDKKLVVVILLAFLGVYVIGK